MTANGHWPIPIGNIHKHDCRLLAEKAAQEIYYINAPRVWLACDPFGKVSLGREPANNTPSDDLLCLIATDQRKGDVMELVLDELEFKLSRGNHG